MEDIELLREYAQERSEPAFTELVNRHINFVYSTALRVGRDSQLAEDVAQLVFIRLARKAGSLSDRAILSGWLYRTTQFVSLTVLRSDWRRRERENTAMQLTELNRNSESVWKEVAPLLDEAMTRLGKVEQDAVLLRFFSGKSLREIGGALGISEDAAQKRVNRALEKMRGYFMRHGAVVPAAAIIPAVSTHALQAAPAGLASTLISTSLSGGEGTVFGEWDLVWHGASVQTDANGRFIFPRVAAGDVWLTHTVAVQPGDGRQSGHHYVRLAPGSRMQLQLGGVGSTIVGRVERNPGERLTFYGSMWANQTIDVEVLSPQQLVLE